MEFVDQIKQARRVSTPLVCVRTFDPKSTRLAIINSLNGKKDTTPLLFWDALNGLLNMNENRGSKESHLTILREGQLEQEATRNFSPVLSAIAKAALMPKSVLSDSVIFVANAHMQWQNQDPNVIQGLWNLRDILKRIGSMVVLLTTPGASLPPELVNDVLMLDEPLPTVEQLGAIVENLYKGALSADSLTPDIKTKAVDALIGVPTFAAEQATAMSMAVTGTADKTVNVTTLDFPQIWSRKRDSINNSPGLSVNVSKEKLADIGGVQAAKDFLRAVMEGSRPPKVIIWYDEIEKGFAGHGTDSSGTKTEMLGAQLTWMQERGILGVLALGIPGVSKSFLPKCLGNEYDIPVIRTDVAAMQAGHVGESNANQRTSIKTIEATAGGGDIMAFATCNSVSSLPAELLRRFDLATFFFDVPTEAEREVIWKIHRTRTGLVNEEPNPASNGWTGDEIRSCCDKAQMLKWTLTKAAKYVVPVTVSDPERIRRIRAEANNRFLSAANEGVYNVAEIESTLAPRPNVSGPRFEEDGRIIR